jgi:oxygen-dependent protoporphyrinogen oxidase
VDILEARGVRLLAGHAADGLTHESAHHVLRFRGGGRHPGQAFDAVISTLPAQALSSLRIDLPVEILAFLTGIPRAPLSVQLLAYPNGAMGRLFPGSGVVACPGAGERFLSCFLPTRMAPFACPDGFHLFRVTAGGARRPETALLDDGEFEALSIEAIRRMFAVRGEPVLSHRVLHRTGIAQIETGHARRLGKAEAWLRENRPGFFLAGTGMAGSGVENAVASGRRAAQAAREFFHPSREGTGSAGTGA